MCVVAFSVAGTLFVGGPTGAALAPFFVAVLGVAAALAGDAWSAGAGDVALSATLTVALLVAYLVARRRT